MLFLLGCTLLNASRVQGPHPVTVNNEYILMYDEPNSWLGHQIQQNFMKQGRGVFIAPYGQLPGNFPGPHKAYIKINLPWFYTWNPYANSVRYIGDSQLVLNPSFGQQPTPQIGQKPKESMQLPPGQYAFVQEGCGACRSVKNDSSIGKIDIYKDPVRRRIYTKLVRKVSRTPTMFYIDTYGNPHPGWLNHR